MTPEERLADIEKEIAASKGKLDALHHERQAARTLPPPVSGTHPMLAMASLQPKHYSIVAQGDSWFDYPPSWDLIDWLSNHHGHDIESIGVAGSTLNDIAYGPVPKNLLGVPQSQDVNRITELINRIEEKQPQAVLLSGGGNDIAGLEFFSLINNAYSSLQNPNNQAVKGVIDETFKKAYEDIIEVVGAKADKMGKSIPIFIHGYDYPWPDGRGVSIFNFVGPWFDETFNKKNYPYDDDPAKLQRRYEIVAGFIDIFNDMLAGLEAKYSGRVYHVDLRGTLQSRAEWANELHPKREGFGNLADKINLSLHEKLQ